MADTNGSPMEAVSSLLAERVRFESWIATLESRKASTPPHVYARVHADYERRLDEVIKRLSSRTGEIESRTGELKLQIDRLQEEENARRDERAEGELRAMVGEFTDEQWTALKVKSDADIARLSSEVGALREELARLEELLRTATAPRRSQETAAVEPEPVTAAAARAEAARAEAPAERSVPVAQANEPAEPAREAPLAEPPKPAPASQSAARSAADESRRGDPIPDTRAFDELAFLKSVVEPRDSVRARVQAPAEPPAPAQAQSSAPVEPRPEPRTEPRAAPAEAPRTTAPGRRPPTPQEPAVAQPPSHIGGDDRSRESVPTFLRDVPNEQAKTLKCQECGTMNYPTEWYCERCGGELAAM